MVRVVEVKITLRSPTILPERRSASGYIGTLNYIPPTTLRGAILTALYLQGKIGEEKLREEDVRPRLIASPAYPIDAEGRRSRPATPFIWECKVSKYIINREEEFVKKIYEDAPLSIPSECAMGHRALKALHPKPIPQVKKVATRHISVAIDKSRGVAVKGMLYSYDVILPPQTYWATLTLPDEYSVDGRFEVRVGRGSSRGFGFAEIEVQREISLGEKAEEYSNCIKGDIVVMVAISPTLQGGIDPQPYPKRLDLANIAAQLGFNIADCTLNIEKVYGKTVRVKGGWNILKDAPRPDYYAKAQGSVVSARIDAKSRKDAAIGLAALAYHGTIEELGYTITGVNMLRVAQEVVK
ncbi:MAG: hypothetical protein HA494_09105 [Thaumarchaeota archaeon]|nr:hypothetical protein [Nitrososphaerota archaeon]